MAIPLTQFSSCVVSAAVRIYYAYELSKAGSSAKIDEEDLQCSFHIYIHTVRIQLIESD